MDATKLSAIVGIILALSIASERLVEIIKGFFPKLNEPNTDPKVEGRRRAFLQILAVVSGILTAYLARDSIPLEVTKTTQNWSIVGLGLLASGGSGFWNSVLTYVNKVKDLKKLEVQTQKLAVNAAERAVK